MNQHHARVQSRVWRQKPGQPAEIGIHLVGHVEDEIGSGGSAEQRNLLGVLLAIGLTVALVHALAYVEGRHRWGIEPLLLLVTAYGVLYVANALRRATLVCDFLIAAGE